MSHAVGALFYLRVTTLKNVLLSRIRHLKQPKYLAGAVVGIAYFYLVFFRRRMNSGGATRLADAFPAEQMPTVITLSALLLLAVIALYWIVPRSRAALAFSEAEISFLFPAPIRRRTLVHYRLINLQVGLIFTSLIIGVISRGSSFFTGGALIRIVGWWSCSPRLRCTPLARHLRSSDYSIAA